MTSVLIIGAGPVGLSAAIFLKKHGINCRIIDQKPKATETSNAIMVNTRTLEILDSLGLAETAITKGLKITGANYYAGTKILAQIAFDHLDSRYHFGIALPQAQTEQMFADHLAQQDIFVEWNKKLITLTQNTQGITAECQTINGLETINADWCIACDGYRGIAREQVNITRECHDLEQHFLMIDAQLQGDISHQQVHAVFHPHGAVLIIPMRDTVRVVVEISHDPRFKNLTVGDEQTFKEILQERFPIITIKKIDWLSGFWIHECLAKNYRKQRVFLAGDAAHTHSPAGGQGMNTSIQDAWNLAWKLAYVIKQQAQDCLLDSYEIERCQIAKMVLHDSDEITKIATTNKTWLAFLRNIFLSYFSQKIFINKKITNHLMQLDIRYQSSSLIQKNAGIKSNYIDPQNRFTLLLNNHQLAQAQQALNHRQKILCFVSHDIPKEKSPFHLIRPDGYFAGIYEKLEQVEEYFQKNGFKK